MPMPSDLTKLRLIAVLKGSDARCGRVAVVVVGEAIVAPTTTLLPPTLHKSG